MLSDNTIFGSLRRNDDRNEKDNGCKKMDFCVTFDWISIKALLENYFLERLLLPLWKESPEWTRKKTYF